MSAGAFGWKRRMGIHEAYHRSGANRAVHWICIPLQLWAVTKLLSLVTLGPLHDLALVALFVLAPIYLVTEPFLGALMVLFLYGCRELALRFLPALPVAGAIAATAVFVASFVTQLRLGHAFFEEGRDDTNQNIAELRRTKNPVPILLVFYFHLVEIVLAAGYRPSLKREIDAFAADELRRLADETR